MTRKGKHPKKEIAKALDESRRAGMTIDEVHRGHQWGRVVCPGCGKGWRVPSTPRVPEDHGRQIRKFAGDHRDHVDREED